jgi:CheY-like chemotaxis protein
MDPETLSHVFEPFFTTKGEAKGTGLGLSTVYGIVKQSNGYILTTTEAGKGTTFKIYLPGLDRAAEPLSSAAESAPSGHETILLVEDAHVVRKLARELLEFRGYSVIEASSGEEAIDVCKTHGAMIDLLLSDIIMPNMNGRELAELAAKLRPQMKILLMSGYADEITRNQLVRNGYQFIAKPFTSNALAVKVREVLDR